MEIEERKEKKYVNINDVRSGDVFKVYEDGSYFMKADSDRIFAIDLETGETKASLSAVETVIPVKAKLLIEEIG